MEEADLLADTIAIMAHGRCGLVGVGAPGAGWWGWGLRGAGRWWRQGVATTVRALGWMLCGCGTAGLGSSKCCVPMGVWSGPCSPPLCPRAPRACHVHSAGWPPWALPCSSRRSLAWATPSPSPASLTATAGPAMVRTTAAAVAAMLGPALQMRAALEEQGGRTMLRMGRQLASTVQQQLMWQR